jgi:hypothetical protein
MNSPLSLQPNTVYHNTYDGKQYTFKQMNPDGSATMVDKDTQEEYVLPPTTLQEQQINKGQGGVLKPVMKTQAKNEVDKVKDHLLDDINSEIEEIKTHDEMLKNDIKEILDDAKLYNELSKDTDDDKVDIIKDVNIPEGPNIDTIEKSDILPLNIKSTHIPWSEYRKRIFTLGQIERMKKIKNHLNKVGLTPVKKDISYKQLQRDTDDSGHSKVNNIPVSGPKGEKSMGIGLTEFPKGQNRNDSVGLNTGKGYNISMKEMDENHVSEREKFNNEHRQYINSMTIRQLRELLKGTTDEIEAVERGKGLQEERKPSTKTSSIEEETIARSVGLMSLADIDLVPEEESNDPSIPKDAPVVHKPTQKAPQIPEYKEPGLIEPAPKEVRVFIDKFMQHYYNLHRLKEELQTELEPYKRKITEIQTEKSPAIDLEEKMMKEALELAYKAISITEDGIVHYQHELWAALSRVKTIKPAVTAKQIIEEARKIDQHLAEQIERLEELVGSKSESKVRERFLYEFPPSKSHEKRLKPESSLIKSAMESLVEELNEVTKNFVSLASDILKAIKNLKVNFNL